MLQLILTVSWAQVQKHPWMLPTRHQQYFPAGKKHLRSEQAHTCRHDHLLLPGKGRTPTAKDYCLRIIKTDYEEEAEKKQQPTPREEERAIP